MSLFVDSVAFLTVVRYGSTRRRTSSCIVWNLLRTLKGLCRKDTGAMSSNRTQRGAYFSSSQQATHKDIFSMQPYKVIEERGLFIFLHQFLIPRRAITIYDGFTFFDLNAFRILTENDLLKYSFC
uniref:Secreted protein n=1 Tax=Steinernema glaseri TaxID=37863 RepID=A0A1I7Z1J8_9BILA